MDATHYDSDLQMFRDTPRLNASKLRFMQWLAEHDRLSDDLPIDQPIRRDIYRTIPLD